jgi:Peptidase A4 family
MSQKPIPDPATRLDLTKQLLAAAQIPKAPPVGFNAIEATSDELKSYGLPPKPDAKANPERYLKWSKHLSKPLTFVAPTFKIIENDRTPSAKDLTKVANGATSGNWSGYANLDPSPNKYSAIEGEWIIPNPYPNSSHANGTYYVSLWVGLDGIDGSGDVLQAGTDAYVTVSGGTTTSQSAFAWYEWYPAYPIIFSNFPVHPGDTIWGYIDAESTTEGFAYLFNEGAGTYTSVTFPAPSGTSLQGNSAEWIVEDPGIPETPFPNFGSTAFFDTYAYSGTWQNLSNGGTPITLIEGGVTLAKSIDETPTSFIVSYE